MRTQRAADGSPVCEKRLSKFDVPGFVTNIREGLLHAGECDAYIVTKRRSRNQASALAQNMCVLIRTAEVSPRCVASAQSRGFRDLKLNRRRQRNELLSYSRSQEGLGQASH